MISPSPDWFVGVSALELCQPDCTWLESKIVDLYPWDAGTDKGTTYDVISFKFNFKTIPLQFEFQFFHIEILFFS